MRDILVWGLPALAVTGLLAGTWWQLRRRGRKGGR